MRRLAGMHHELADPKGRVVLELDNLDAYVVVEEPAGAGASGDVDGNPEFSGDFLGAPDMIPVFVSQNDRVDVLEAAADRFESPGHLAGTESGVDEDARAVTLEKVRVSFAA